MGKSHRHITKLIWDGFIDYKCYLLIEQFFNVIPVSIERYQDTGADTARLALYAEAE